MSCQVSSQTAVNQAKRRLQLVKSSLKPIALAEKQSKRACFTFEQYERSLYTVGFLSGETRLKNVLHDLDCVFPDGKFDLQMKIHSQGLRACLRMILGRDYKSSIHRVCSQYGYPSPKQNAFFLASRRGGKTTAMASLVAAILVNCPNINVVNFSGGEDSANEFTQLVGFYAEKMGRGRKVKITQKKTVVYHSSNVASTIKAFPSGGKSYDVSFISFTCFLFFLFSTR